MKKQYACIGMGGTFDRLHYGHSKFIAFAAALADRVVIGVTNEEMTQKKLFPQLIEPVSARLTAVREFCTDHKINAEVVQLHDVYGPTIHDQRIAAVAVTEDSVSGGNAINDKRKLQNLAPLPLQVFQLIRDDIGKPITSTRIRSGEIDRLGFRYSKILDETLTLTEKQRAFFSQQLEPIVHGAPTIATAPTYVVGDICLANFHENSWDFHAGWFDAKTSRTESVQSNWPITYKTTNPAGTISLETTQNLQAILSTHTQLWSIAKLPMQKSYTLVRGEEDLCALGLVLLAPLDSNIYYGQPNQGMVQLTVTEALKQKCKSML